MTFLCCLEFGGAPMASKVMVRFVSLAMKLSLLFRSKWMLSGRCITSVKSLLTVLNLHNYDWHLFKPKKEISIYT